MHSFALLAVIAATILTVALAVLLHYEGLYRMRLRYRTGRTPEGRRHVLSVIFGVLLLHMVQIWMFGVAWWGLLQMQGTGHIVGAGVIRWHDALFMSVLAFTSLGFDNLAPVGAIRILAGTEALTGFVLVTWSASFAFLQMGRHWKID
jgi:hypothetical protein